MYRLLVSACVLLVSFTPLHAGGKAAKRPITLEDLWKVQRLGKPAISPDGEWVAVEVTTFSMDDNTSTSDLWLLSTDGKTQKQLTSRQGKRHRPGLVARRQIDRLRSKRAGDVAADPPHLPRRRRGPASLAAADGAVGPQVVRATARRSTASSGPGPTRPTTTATQKKEKAQKDDKVQAFVIDDALFRFWDHWIADGKRPVVFAVDVATGKHKNLFAGVETAPCRSSGGVGGRLRRFARRQGNLLHGRVGQGDRHGLQPRPLRHAARQAGRAEEHHDRQPGQRLQSRVLPDGKWIAFLRQTTKFFYADRHRIMVLIGTRASRQMTRIHQGPRSLVQQSAVCSRD